MGMGVRTVTSSENLAACGPSNVVLREDIAADDYDCQTHACAYDMPMNSIRSDESQKSESIRKLCAEACMQSEQNQMRLCYCTTS